jgi:hypothetical protein
VDIGLERTHLLGHSLAGRGRVVILRASMVLSVLNCSFPRGPVRVIPSFILSQCYLRRKPKLETISIPMKKVAVPKVKHIKISQLVKKMCSQQAL